MNNTPDKKLSDNRPLKEDVFANNNLTNEYAGVNTLWNQLVQILIAGGGRKPEEAAEREIKFLCSKLILAIKQSGETLAQTSPVDPGTVQKQVSIISNGLGDLHLHLQDIGLENYLLEEVEKTLGIHITTSTRVDVWRELTVEYSPQSTNRISFISQNQQAAVTSLIQETDPQPGKYEKIIAAMRENKKKFTPKAPSTDDTTGKTSMPTSEPCTVIPPASIDAKEQNQPQTDEPKPVNSPISNHIVIPKAEIKISFTDNKPAVVTKNVAVPVPMPPVKNDQPAIKPQTPAIQHQPTEQPPKTPADVQSKISGKIKKALKLGTVIGLPILGLSFLGFSIIGSDSCKANKTPQISKTSPPPSASATEQKTDHKKPESKTPVTTIKKTAPQTYGLNSLSRDFQSYQNRYFRQTSFENILSRAMDNTRVELSGQETATEAKIKAYRAFLQECIEQSGTEKTVKNFCKIRDREAAELQEKIKASSDKNAITPFAEKSRAESRLLFNAVPAPTPLPEQDPNIGYAVDRNPVHNHTWAYVSQNFPKTASGIYSTLNEAFDIIENEHPCPDNRPASFRNCVFGTLTGIAQIHRERNPKDDSLKIINQLEEQASAPHFLNKIIAVTKPVSSGSQPTSGRIMQSPSSTSNQPSPKPASATPPIHSQNIPHPQTNFGVDENTWFNNGEKLSEQNIKETVENHRFVEAYPEWFPHEPKAKQPSLFTRATAYLKKLFKNQPTPEEQEQAELMASIPKKSFWKNLIG